MGCLERKYQESLSNIFEKMRAGAKHLLFWIDTACSRWLIIENAVSKCARSSYYSQVPGRPFLRKSTTEIFDTISLSQPWKLESWIQSYRVSLSHFPTQIPKKDYVLVVPLPDRVSRNFNAVLVRWPMRSQQLSKGQK